MFNAVQPKELIFHTGQKGHCIMLLYQMSCRATLIFNAAQPNELHNKSMFNSAQPNELHHRSIFNAAQPNEPYQRSIFNAA